MGEAQADRPTAPREDHRHASAALGGAFWTVAALFALEVAGGIVADSLAVLGDAAHLLTDLAALGLAWYATRLARRPATPRRSYGFLRAGILAALFNAASLGVLAVALLVLALWRLGHPARPTPWIMASVAAVALAVNVGLGQRLRGHAHGDLNVRAARWHVLGDAAASAGVLAAAGLTALTHRLWWDPVLAAGIALLIARGAWRLLGEALDVLMEGTPAGIDPGEVARAMTEDAAVLAVHHVHIWSLDGVHAALSAHVVLPDGPVSETRAVLERLACRLRQRFAIAHATLQVETPGAGGCPEADGCPGVPAARAGRL